MSANLSIVGGRVVTPDGVRQANLLIEGGRIASVTNDESRGQVVDASGLLVFPGMVDTHVHLMDPGPTEREDFPTGTAAAAARGVTTIVEHTHAHPIRQPVDLEGKRSHLAGRANVDFGLAAHVWPEHIPDLPALWHSGITFYKIFTCTTHGVPGLRGDALLEALRTLAGLGAPCLVHCEDEDITESTERALRSQGRTDPGVLIEWRNREAELAAVAATGALVAATGCRATIAHVSNPMVADVVTSARSWGADLGAEACPQYFALREEEVLEHGPLRKFTPPARIRFPQDEQAMWDRLEEGVFTHIATDHAPSTLEQKQEGSIWDAPFGLPGLDTTFPFFLDAALSGRIGLSDLARLYSESPARRYGLSPRKGWIRVGADADLVLVDPDGTWTVTHDEVISKAGWSPFAGLRLKGRVVSTFLRGEVIAESGVPLDALTGEFLPGPGKGTTDIAS